MLTRIQCKAARGNSEQHIK